MFSSSLKTGTTTESAGARVGSFIAGASDIFDKAKPANYAAIDRIGALQQSPPARPIRSRPGCCAARAFSSRHKQEVRCGRQMDSLHFLRCKSRRASPAEVTSFQQTD